MDKEMKLSDHQLQALELSKEGRNLFITGGAGTGKSYLIKEIYNELKDDSKNVYLTSSTGVSALNIGGMTLHKYIGCGLAEESVEILYKKLQKNKPALLRIKNTDVIIIDEISMINAEFFNKINYLLQKVMNDNGNYFGGIQIITVGDFFQLPPIFKNKQEKTYLFNSDIWRNLFDEIIELQFVFRQKDDTIYSNLLNRIRYGELNSEDEKLLRSRLNIIKKEDILGGKTTLNSVPIFYPFRTDAKNLNMIN